MIPIHRIRYNQSVTDENYREFVNDLENYAGEQIPFRIAETPVFVPIRLRKKLESACEAIIEVIKHPDFISTSERAIPKGLKVPGAENKSMWLAFDFAICRDKNPFFFISTCWLGITASILMFRQT